jgi:hypothetical protein
LIEKETNFVILMTSTTNAMICFPGSKLELFDILEENVSASFFQIKKKKNKTNYLSN